MGRYTVEEAIEYLQRYGHRAGRAYPGKLMPQIQVPTIAVALHEEDALHQVLAVTVLCPANLGGSRCENTAMEVVKTLKKAGFACLQEHCQFDGRGDRFSVRILATWHDPPADPPYVVLVNRRMMPSVVRFTAEQKTEVEMVGEIGEDAPVHFLTKQMPWEFTIEERLPIGVDEPYVPQEPFEMEVCRGKTTEQYSGCFWTSYYAQDSQDGMHVIRKGIATQRRML